MIRRDPRIHAEAVTASQFVPSAAVFSQVKKMEASTPKMPGPGANRPPEPTFVRLYNQQFQGGKGGVSQPFPSQRRGPGQDYMEMEVLASL